MAIGFSESQFFGMLLEPPVSRSEDGGGPLVWFKLLSTHRFSNGDQVVREEVLLYCRIHGSQALAMLNRKPKEMLLVRGRIRTTLTRKLPSAIVLDVSEIQVLCRPAPRTPHWRSS